MQVPVHWWHGDSDHIVPHAHGVHMAARLPHARFTTIDGESHLGGLGVATEVLSRADGARAALDRPVIRDISDTPNRPSAAFWRGRRLASVTMGSQVHTCTPGHHDRSLLHRPRPLGKAYLDAGARGGPS